MAIPEHSANLLASRLKLLSQDLGACARFDEAILALGDSCFFSRGLYRSNKKEKYALKHAAALICYLVLLFQNGIATNYKKYADECMKVCGAIVGWDKTQALQLVNTLKKTLDDAQENEKIREDDECLRQLAESRSNCRKFLRKWNTPPPAA